MLTALLSLLMTASLPQYSSPINYEITLAGNFGEPRPNHFHGGIDIKTEGREGKHIYSIGDGYVSRLTVGLYGFGNAVYVTHPEGYTSIYCHLKRFVPRLERMIAHHRENGEKLIDACFTPETCPVSRGQLIAVSGNSGASRAPHLHLEVHDTRTGNMLDPLDFIGYLINDHQAPTAYGFNAYPQYGEGTFNRGVGKQTYAFSSRRLTRTFKAWGKVGFGIWANDNMEATYNNYGVRETILMVDGRTVFHSNVDNIPLYQNRMINSWGDYDHWRTRHVWYMRSYIEPGNTLPFLSADSNRGIICFNEERDYQLVYQLSDHFGNTSTYQFTVHGEPCAIPQKRVPNMKLLMRQDRISCYSLPGMQLVIPAGNLGSDIELLPRVKSQPGRLSSKYLFMPVATPLFMNAKLSIALNHNVSNTEKLCIKGSNGCHYYGSYQDGWLTVSIRDLGVTYEVIEEK